MKRPFFFWHKGPAVACAVDERGAAPARRRQTRTWGFVLALVASCSGCHAYSLYQHRHTGTDFHGEKHITYYHYPHGSWFVPAHQRCKNCPTIVEPPFHGYAATCWTRWPDGWQGCPSPCGQQPCYEVLPGEILPGTSPQEVIPSPGAAPLNGAEGFVPNAAERIVLHGKFGFSSPLDEDVASVAIVELPPREDREELPRTAAADDQSSGSRR